MREVSITIPDYLRPEDVAKIFTAYRLGASALSLGETSRGPFLLEENRWQLDPSNDFWFRVDASGEAILSSRYDNESLLSAMATLFHEQNPIRDFRPRFLPKGLDTPPDSGGSTKDDKVVCVVAGTPGVIVPWVRWLAEQANTELDWGHDSDGNIRVFHLGDQTSRARLLKMFNRYKTSFKGRFISGPDS